MGDGQVVVEELVSAIMAPEGGHLAQQHVILVVLAHGQPCHLHHQMSMQSVNYTVTYMAHTRAISPWLHSCAVCIAALQSHNRWMNAHGLQQQSEQDC